METRLSEAAMKGSVDSLMKILQENPLILDRTIVSCISETPLHTAAMLGLLHFVKELLTLKPELAAELDFHGAAPLHLAAAKGHAEVERQLLLADPEICTVRNEDGRTPLHVAAFKGRAEVVSELARVKPVATRVVTDRGETVLHLCVMQNRLEALRALVEAMGGGGGHDGEIVNWKDSDGNTVLHVAVAKKLLHIWNRLNQLLNVKIINSSIDLPQIYTTSNQICSIL